MDLRHKVTNFPPIRHTFHTFFRKIHTICPRKGHDSYCRSCFLTEKKRMKTMRKVENAVSLKLFA